MSINWFCSTCCAALFSVGRRLNCLLEGVYFLRKRQMASYWSIKMNKWFHINKSIQNNDYKVHLIRKWNQVVKMYKCVDTTNITLYVVQLYASFFSDNIWNHSVSTTEKSHNSVLARSLYIFLCNLHIFLRITSKLGAFPRLSKPA